uniref:Putative movement protein 2 n=3 Tax=TGP Carmovirus 3 TaxID=944582 RepID=F2YS80_9TOMB|nr:putative movement protein 2 [TGP Carmovirus 3]
MASARVHLGTLSVLILLQLLIRSPITLRLTFDFDPSPNLLSSIVLSIFFVSVLGNSGSVHYYYQANSTADKFISVAVGK